MPRRKAQEAPEIDPDAPPPYHPLKAFYAWPPGTTASEKKDWTMNSPIILWAEDAKDARARLKQRITDAQDWEYEEIPKVIT